MYDGLLIWSFSFVFAPALNRNRGERHVGTELSSLHGSSNHHTQLAGIYEFRPEIPDLTGDLVVLYFITLHMAYVCPSGRAY